MCSVTSWFVEATTSYLTLSLRQIPVERNTDFSIDTNQKPPGGADLNRHHIP